MVRYKRFLQNAGNSMEHSLKKEIASSVFSISKVPDTGNAFSFVRELPNRLGFLYLVQMFFIL